MFRFLEHTADFKIQVISDSLEKLFEESLEAINAFLNPKLGKEKLEIDIEIQSENLLLLYIDFLSEILAKTYIEKKIFKIKELKIDLDNYILKAKLEGNKFLSIEKDIKAITYHQAKIENVDSKYLGEFVIDV